MNQPAFPTSVPLDIAANPQYAGMTLRDYFAIRIMCSGELNPDMTPADAQRLAALCYRLADLMIQVRG